MGPPTVYSMMEPSTRAGRESLTATRFGVAMAMSLVLHAVALWELPAMQRLRPGPVDPEGITLSVQLAPPPSPPPQAALERRQLPRALAPPAPRAAPERSPPRPAAPPAAETPAVSAAARRPAEPDLMAYVEARRRARNAPAEDAASPPRAQLSENERASRAAAANLASSSTMVFGYDPSRSGGVFQIDRLSSDYAEISFSGWHAGARRHMKQLIEVRRGTHADIRIAVVRDIISVIRKYEPEEFTWDSQRLGRSLTLSSLPRDNAGLEDFMMLEFFSGPKPIYGAGR
jgi:hypothetical protein